MIPVRHMANLTKNNRRLARFYSLIFGMEGLWNEWQNSSAAFYITDGYLNFNCLEFCRLCRVRRVSESIISGSWSATGMRKNSRR